MHNALVDEVVVRADRRQVWPALLTTLPSLGVAVLLVREGSPAARAIGLAGIVLFGLGALVVLATLVRPSAVLTINREGVRLGGGLRYLDRMLPWSSIAAVRIYDRKASPIGSRRERTLGFIPSDPDAEIWTERLGTRFSMRHSGQVGAISERLISGNLERVVDIMRRYQPGLRLDDSRPR